MKKQVLRILVLAACACQSYSIWAQTPSDDLMMKKREICLAAGYETGSWDEYWEGTRLRTNANIGTFTRTAIMPMVAYGITDKINFLAGVPYISTEATGGQLVGAKGMQDLSLAVKAQLWDQQLGPGKASFFTTVGYSFPVSNYLSDYMPFSIGLKTREATLRGILQYRMDMGLYARGTFAYLWRGQSKVERDYYYNNGSFYSEWMDVPNALNYSGTVGIWLFNSALKVEANYIAVHCVSGDDIRIYNTPQPTNKMNFDQVGVFAHYFFKGNTLKGLGLMASYGNIINGRNMGKAQSVGGGVTYQFQL